MSRRTAPSAGGAEGAQVSESSCSILPALRNPSTVGLLLIRA